uniref:FAD dependent oxidoreductase domain-containing protein n=1 Tax=Timema tahoe TaxID=61484 RepID=A0A7R9IBD2_9NEOP|nr:unnamed protein product [Timema tahoe]
MGSMQIGILGAGVVGLNTALELQRQFPTARLTIIADKFNEETTSDGAAGIFRPSTSFSGPTENITKFVKPHLSLNTETTATGNSSEWIQRSYDYYNELYLSEQASLAGVNRVSGHIVSSISPEIVRNHFLEKVVPIFRAATQDELLLYPGNWKYGSFFTTLITECHKFQPWALSSKHIEQDCIDKHNEQDCINKHYEQDCIDKHSEQDCINKHIEQVCIDKHSEQDCIDKHYEQDCIDKHSEQDCINKHSEQDCINKHSEQDCINKHYEQDCIDKHSEQDCIDKHSEQDCIDKHSEQGCIDKHSEQDCIDKHSEQDCINKHSEQDCIDKHSEQDCINKHIEQGCINKHSEQDCIDKHIEQVCIDKHSEQDCIDKHIEQVCIDKHSEQDCINKHSEQDCINKHGKHDCINKHSEQDCINKHSEFQQDSGHIIKRRINSFQELVGDFDIVVNCTGLGAKYLCSDYKLVPIRGQVLKVRAPWLKTFLYADFDTYIVPGSLATTIGGCRQYESYDLDVSPHDSAAIKERAFRLIPGLKRAPVIREWVGLRPHRSIVRVETEIINTTSGKLKVVHNYGHGGYGVMTAPGTAQHAVQLVKGLHLAGLGNSKL